MNGKVYTFDSFECAIHKLAPECAHCGCKIVGPGSESKGKYFCCAHCAPSDAATQIVDHAAHAGVNAHATR